MNEKYKLIESGVGWEKGLRWCCVVVVGTYFPKCMIDNIYIILYYNIKLCYSIARNCSLLQK